MVNNRTNQTPVLDPFAGKTVTKAEKHEQREINADLFKQIFQQEEPQATPDVAKAMIVQELMGRKNLNRVTEVSNFDIAMLAAGKGVNSKANSQVFKQFANAFLEMRVSHERKGRSEVVEITRQLSETIPPTEKPGWRLGRLFS